MKYRVTVYFSQCYEVEAENEEEAEEKAHMQLKNLNTIPIPDSCEVECLDERDRCHSTDSEGGGEGEEE